MPDLLPPHLLRSLGQKEYDKRKGAALEIEQAIKDLREAGQHERVREVVLYVVNDLAGSPHPNVRKGALHALAGVAIGLRSELPEFLPQILPPILASFCDPDCRVRYYACESLYNVAKVARGHCVRHFNEIFEALFKLSADTDLGVQNGFQLLDRLMKDIVAESDHFDIAAFMPLLRRRVFVANSYTRQFLIGWIAILDSVPDIDMLEHLPEFFDGLFHMLSDLNKEIRQQAYAVLYDFLQEIKAAPQLKYEPIVAILVAHCGSRDRFSRLTALTWLHAFLSLGKAQLLPFCPAVLEAVLRSISHGEDEIRDAAAQTDRALRALLDSCSDAEFDVEAILGTLVLHARSEQVRTRLTAFEWLEMVLRQRPAALLRHSDSLWPPLLDALGDQSEDVLFLDIEIIARLAAQRGHFAVALGRVMGRLAESRVLLEARAPLILRQLTLLLEPRLVYLEVASVIRASSDLAFCALMVQTLNGILHSSPALRGLRESLRSAIGSGSSAATATALSGGGGLIGGGGGGGAKGAEAAKSGVELFQQLYAAWCHAPVALLSLCLLAEVRASRSHPIPSPSGGSGIPSHSLLGGVGSHPIPF
jgi:vacuole morphology and inheritance protein 14